nr:MAG TPA: hypothetical protein [Caudoviricetes sp.]
MFKKGLIGIGLRLFLCLKRYFCVQAWSLPFKRNRKNTRLYWERGDEAWQGV